jgi:hypothetical protein
MTGYQRAKRYAFWRGSAITLLACSGFMLASALAGCITG